MHCFLQGFFSTWLCMDVKLKQWMHICFCVAFLAKDSLTWFVEVVVEETSMKQMKNRGWIWNKKKNEKYIKITFKELKNRQSQQEPWLFEIIVAVNVFPCKAEQINCYKMCQLLFKTHHLLPNIIQHIQCVASLRGKPVLIENHLLLLFEKSYGPFQTT